MVMHHAYSDLLTCTNDLLSVMGNHEVAQLGNAQYIRQIRALISRVIEPGNQITQTIAENVTAEQLIQRRLQREIIHLARKIDEVIRQLSFEASFNLKVSEKSRGELGNLVASLRQTSSDLQKNLLISHR